MFSSSTLRCALPVLGRSSQLNHVRVVAPLVVRSFASSSSLPPESASLSSQHKRERPFRVLGVQQIAIGAEDREAMTALWQGIFGLQPSSSVRLEGENVEEDILQVGPAPYSVEIDLMTPIDPNKSPKVHKPPLNHIGLWVDDLFEAVSWMEQEGVRFTPGGIRKGAAGHDVAFIHPRGSEKQPVCGNGVLIELVQAPTAVVEAFAKTSTSTDDDSNGGNK